METWLGKTQIMTMLTQTKEKKTIHPKHWKEMMRPKHKLSEQWRKRHEALQDTQTQKAETTQELMQELMQEPTQEPKQETTKKSNNKENRDTQYAKRQKQTDIAKLVKENPEMPKTRIG